MKKWLSKKAIITILGLTIILGILASISYSVYNYSKTEVEYTLELNQDTKIENIKVNGGTYNFYMFVDGVLTLDENSMLCTTDANKTLYMKLYITDDVYISYKNDLKVTRDGVYLESENNTFSYTVDKLDIIKTSISSKCIIYFLIAIVAIALMITYLYAYYNLVKEDKVKLYHILGAIICMFLIFYSTYYILFLVLGSFVILPIICVIAYNLYTMIYVENKKIHLIYATFIVIVSVAMLYMMAPFNVPDETSHFYRAYKDSLFVGNTDDGGLWCFPKDVGDLTGRFGQNVHSQENKVIAKNYISEVFKTNDYKNLNSYPTNYGNVKNLSFLPYLPSALILAIGRVLNMTLFTLYLLCRLANLLISVSLSYIALKIAPKFKKLVLVVTMFPIFIQQSAALNMDYLTNATIIMIISFILYLIYEAKNVDLKQILILVGLCTILVLCKFGYFPILLLLFLIPNDKFKNKKIAIVVKCTFVALVFLISFVLNINAANGSNIEIPQEQDTYGIGYIFENPLRMAKIIISTMINRLDLDCFRGFIDGFGYSNIWNRGIFSLLQILMFFFFIIIHDDEDDTLNLLSRIAYIVSFCMIVGIVYVIAFVFFTKAGAKDMFGVQARYFVAPSLLLYIGLTNNIINLKIKEKKNLYSVIIAMSFITAFISLSFFFV